LIFAVLFAAGGAGVPLGSVAGAAWAAEASPVVMTAAAARALTSDLANPLLR
jgi:hypothetical protein